MSNGTDIAALLGGLTEKQRDVLDLLVLHKTSKQIARELGISPHTVDQRITAARTKFGVDNRNELAAEYRRARVVSDGTEIYESPVYQSSQVGMSGDSGNEGSGTGAMAAGGMHPERSKDRDGKQPPVTYFRVVPESFEGRNGYFWRLTAIVGITLGLLIAALVGLAIYGELSELLR